MYSTQRRGLHDDPDPTIPAKGYFYLTNKRAIFDSEFVGRRDEIWGDSADEAYGCDEPPDNLWGVRYKIANVRGNTIRVQNARWTRTRWTTRWWSFTVTA